MKTPVHSGLYWWRDRKTNRGWTVVYLYDCDGKGSMRYKFIGDVRAFRIDELTCDWGPKLSPPTGDRP